MNLIMHFSSSLVLAFILYPIFKYNALIVLIGGFLIDIDHYLWYIFKFKKFSLKDCYYYCGVLARNDNWRSVSGSLLIFHTIEFLFLMVVLSFYFKSILIFTIGLLLHYIMDFIWYFYVIKRFVLNHSIILWFIKNKIQKV